MKRTTIPLLTALMCLSACGSTEPDAPATTTTLTTTTATTTTTTAAQTADVSNAFTGMGMEPVTEDSSYPEIDIVWDKDGMEMLKIYQQISQDTAKELMAEDNGSIIVDVRRPDEFAEGHIPGAVCIPNEEIGTEMPARLPDLGQVILVYCRSGRRSKEAAQKLADMGYIRVYEFGGIIDWTGEVVTGE